MSLRRGAPKRWSLEDTYGFIAWFCEANTRTYAANPRLQPPVRSFHSRSRPLYSPNTQGQRAQSETSPATTATRDPVQPPAEPEPNFQTTSTSTSSSSTSASTTATNSQPVPRRGFHTYFVTHLPSSSLHPDSATPAGPHHNLPRGAASPYSSRSGAAPLTPPHLPSTRDLTVVRIPLRSAKHHFGVAESRGSRPYNEDANQAGTIDMPAFAKRAPISLVRNAMKKSGEGTSADSPYGDPQIFYFGVFDGHGGTQCSDFLRDELHGYIEEAAVEFGLKSSLRTRSGHKAAGTTFRDTGSSPLPNATEQDDKSSAEAQEATVVGLADANGMNVGQPPGEASRDRALQLQRELIAEYKNTIGGYFRRFNPPHFNVARDGETTERPIGVESVLTYAFLRADLDFVAAQAQKRDPDDPYVSDIALNTDEILGKPHHMPPSGHGIGGRTRFKGGSTASVALISTPTPAPFWHPAASSTLIVGHVGDTRILLCETATGRAKPLTSDHHPGSPGESHRLRRFATSFVTDSFGEERIQGLANSRAFGDIGSKRLGVSAEPEITRTELGPAQYSFLVLMSDGVSGSISDQEIVDIIKEAKTPEQGSKDVVAYATEVGTDGDNATCLVVRLGGWERRSEGGLGSLGTKEMRDYRRNEAMDPRRGRQ
ncbi:protein serine/threonine phosphatase 2C [Poronia punctata]|nr:protein serine/threonine phosphatase 2C [Poronia punctata]